MAVRKSWSGKVQITKMWNFDVEMFGATQDGDTHGHQLHNKCNGRISYKKWCDQCNCEVEYSDIIKGFESGFAGKLCYSQVETRIINKNYNIRLIISYMLLTKREIF